MEKLERVIAPLQIFLYRMDLKTLQITWSAGSLENIIGFNPLAENSNPVAMAETFYHPKDRHLVQERIRLFQNKEIENWSGIYRIRHHQGHWVWVFSKHQLLNTIAKPQLACMMMNASTGLNTQEQLNTLISEAIKLKNSDRIKKLTHRELTIIKLIARGFSYTNIAAQLIIQPDTVNQHRKNILKKLGLPNIATLVCFAKEVGLA